MTTPAARGLLHTGGFIPFEAGRTMNAGMLPDQVVCR